jgi:hypothetical protein
MTEQDIINYKGKVNDGKTFTNPNIGKTRLNSDDEYTFELKETKIKQGVKNFKGQAVDKVYMILIDIKYNNKVLVGFRIDTLTWNEEKPQFQSPIISFFSKLGMPIVEGEYPDWSQYFIPTMKFNARVTPIIKDGVHQDNYKLELATVRKYNIVKPNIVDLDEAKKIIVGSANGQDALLKLTNSGCSVEIIQAFLTAEQQGKFVYPIQ